MTESELPVREAIEILEQRIVALEQLLSEKTEMLALGLGGNASSIAILIERVEKLRRPG